MKKIESYWQFVVFKVWSEGWSCEGWAFGQACLEEMKIVWACLPLSYEVDQEKCKNHIQIGQHKSIDDMPSGIKWSQSNCKF